jgi:5-methyltetrahydrofolate--homocysteine methyltransferase
MSTTMGRENIADRIGSGLLIADGSTGTALESLSPGIGAKAALLPLTDPALLGVLHGAYFDSGAMLVETATFTSSARGLEAFAESGVYGIRDPGELAYAVNRAGAEAAAIAARAAEARTGETRWVAGSIGPGESPPSFGMATWKQLYESYLPQARGLADGGADLAIVETCQDPLQIKAALAALMSPDGGRGLPFIVSATVDASRRMLAGTSLAAFVAIVAPFKPLALGLNCSGGPDELEESLAELASLSSLPICFMPNAGLPERVESRTIYPFGPEVFAAKVGAMVRKYGVAIVGGCCGTGPAHIAALRAALRAELGREQDNPTAPSSMPASAQQVSPAANTSTSPQPRADGKVGRRPSRPSALASLYEARPIGPELFLIGAKANTSRSAAFAALLDASDFDGMAEMALDQEGAGALDLRVAREGRNEVADMTELVGSIALRARAALCVDSGDPRTLEAVLSQTGGRVLVRSVSLADVSAARQIFALARRHGAAVVCRCVDEEGGPRSLSGITRIGRELYDLATGEFGLLPEALFFDPIVFPLATEPGAAAATLDAIPAIRSACPGSSTIIAPGDFSRGMPGNIQSQAESVFLSLARARGLDAAILDIQALPPVDTLDSAFREAIELRIAQGL